MAKLYRSLQEYHDADSSITFQKYEAVQYRIGLLIEKSSDVTFTSTNRNSLVLDLSGTSRHLTQMDCILDETPTRRGDVCLIPPGIEARFAWDVITASQASVILEFDTDLLASFLPDFDQDRFADGHLVPRNFGVRPVLAELTRLLRRETDPSRARGRLFADSVMRLIVFEIASSHWSTPMRQPEVDDGADRRVKRAIDFIESNFSADISLSDIGQASGLSLTQLIARFKKATGKTPYSYVIDRRLNQAVRWLRSSEMSIADVAVETGFVDQQHLTRAFRARLGKTPKQVRDA
jgi:AraC family transcriptional regulator